MIKDEQRFLERAQIVEEERKWRVFQELADLSDDDKTICLYLAGDEDDILGQVKNLIKSSATGVFELGNAERSIMAHFHKGALHSSTQPAWVEMRYPGNRIEAWAKDGQLMAIDIVGGDKFTLLRDENIGGIAMSQKEEDFDRVTKSFKSRPKLKVLQAASKK